MNVSLTIAEEGYSKTTFFDGVVCVDGNVYGVTVIEYTDNNTGGMTHEITFPDEEELVRDGVDVDELRKEILKLI